MQIWRARTNGKRYEMHLFGEFNDPGVAVDVGGLDTGEPCGLGKLLELPLVPLHAACRVREHDHVGEGRLLPPGRRLRFDRQDAFYDDNPAVRGKCTVAVL